MRALILIEVEPGRAGALVADFNKAYEVLGPYDVVMEVEFSHLDEVPRIVRAVQERPEVIRTVTLPVINQIDESECEHVWASQACARCGARRAGV